jgi:hypothetical protein
VRAWLLVVVALTLDACAHPLTLDACAHPQAKDPAPAGRCGLPPLRPWPEADALFQRDPVWLGADAAYSVDLGAGRVLWLFGDTFLARSAARSRQGAWFVRNSVGVQSGGYDPSRAHVTFAWGTRGGVPVSFFPEVGEHWFWPLGAVRLPSRLVLFLLEERRTPSGLGFEAVGTKVVFATALDRDPAAWTFTEGNLPAFPVPLAFGAAVARRGPYVYAFATRERGDHSVSLARFDASALDAGDASSPLFLVGGAWRALGASAPDVVFPGDARDDPPTELSVQPTTDGAWIAVHSVGFGAAPIAVRTAPAIEGPWSRACEVFAPPPGLEGTLVYAAKAHPELTGGSLVLTYATNGPEARVAADPSLYVPRFVRAP